MSFDQQRGLYAVTVPALAAPAKATVVQGNVRLCGWSLQDAVPVAGVTEVTPGNPAAGAVYSLLNNTQEPWTILSVKFTFTADAVVGNRFTSVQWLDSGLAVVTENFDAQAVVASTALTSFYAAGLANIANAASGTAAGGLPSLPLQPGWTLRINVSGIDAGDQLSSIFIAYQQSGIPASAQILDGAQVIGITQTVGPGTEWLSDEGVQAGSGVTVQALAGSVSGCVYVRDVDPGTQLA